MARFVHWLRHNASTCHQRWMMRYLQHRGWVVFYLDPQSRECRGLCWMALYEEQDETSPILRHQARTL